MVRTLKVIVVSAAVPIFSRSVFALIACGAVALGGCSPGTVSVPMDSAMSTDATMGGDMGQPPPASCSDGKKDNSETDTDCGGACSPCADGKACVAGTDCQNAVCSGGMCKAPTCSDGAKNADETDVDCGGSCPKCPGGKGCKVPTDCSTNMCNSGHCAAGPLMFGMPGVFSLGPSPYGIVTGDFNNDKHIDVAVTASDGLNILLNKGDGTFGPPTVYGVTNIPGDPAVADFNKDGNLDVIWPNFNDNTVPVLLGKGDGTFTVGKSMSVPGAPGTAVIGDFDGDHRPDVALALNRGNQVAILLGNGDGTFGAPANYDSGGIDPTGLGVLDLNGDGKDDIAVANSNTNWMNGTQLGGNGNVSSLLNDGTGKLGTATMLATGTAPGRIVVSDLDGDGKLDVIATDYVGGKLIIRLTGSAATTVASGASPADLAAVDFTLDGKPDLVVCNTFSFQVTVFPNVGAGMFGAGMMFPISEPNPNHLAAADLNGDGKPDVAVVNIKYVSMPTPTYTPELDVILNTTM